MVRAILFDLDGTLVNTLPLYIGSYRRALAQQGFDLADREIVDTCFGKTEETICTTLGIPEKTEEFKITYFSAVKNHFTEGKLFQGVIGILNLAKEQSIELAIVSFAYTWYVDEMVKRMQLDRYFSVVIGFNNVKRPKPDPEAAILACTRLGVSPRETMMVGDSKSDIVMGKNAGCTTVLFYPDGYELFYDLKRLKEVNPDGVIKNFGELKELILSS